MVAVSTTAWWVLGSVVAGVVVAVVAALLILIILLARRIVRQTAAITLALDGAMRNTSALFDVANVNHSLESVTRGLERARGERGGLQDERSFAQRVRSRLPGGGS